MVGISYDPKIDAFLGYLGEGKSLDVRTLAAGDLYAAGCEILKDRENIAENIAARAAFLGKLARTDCAAAAEFLEKIN